VKKRLLIDTNVVLDVLMDRQPHVIASAAVFAAIETGSAEGVLAAHAITTIHYLISRQLNQRDARQTLATLLKLFAIAPIDGNVLQQALRSSGADFEDSVTAAAAQASGCHLIVTRDPKGFRGAALPALTPAQALALLR
jgi:predicted nucleic acid-binding protein